MTTLRTANPNDLEAFLRLVLDKKDYAPYPVRDLSSHSQKIAHLSSYRAYWSMDWPANRFQILLAERGKALRGYAVLRGDLLDSVTQQPQTCVYDYWGHSQPISLALLEAARQTAIGFATEHMVVEIAPDNLVEQKLVESLGFAAEIHRVARRAEPWEPPAQSPFRLRPARQSDSLFIIHLNATSLPVVVPPGRPMNMDQVTMDFMSHYATMDLENDEELLVLILEHGRRQAGYLILKRGIPSADLAYVYDIAIDTKYQGQGAAQYLVNAGANAVFREGFKALAGDISATNPRALRTALQGLGFEVERHRYGRPVS